MDTKQCGICGNTIPEAAPPQEPDGMFHGWQDVSLKDGSMVCKECAEKVRIICPLRSSKVFAESAARFGTDTVRGKSVSKRGWLSVMKDPLEQMTLAEFRQTLDSAAQAVQEQAARFPGAKGAAEADFTFRHYIAASGTGTKIQYSQQKEYITCVRVLYGEICPGDVISVIHKDKEYTAVAEEIRFWNYLDIPLTAIDKAFAGITAALLFRTEVPFIYPGDILTVKGN